MSLANRHSSNVNIYSFDKPSPIRTLSGHTSFVYSIATFPDGSGAITTGEDGTMRVWSGKLVCRYKETHSHDTQRQSLSKQFLTPPTRFGLVPSSHLL